MIATDAPDFFNLAAGKLDWLNQRATILAGNVANADTPGYKPRDLAPFSSFLSGSSLGLTTTDPADLPAVGSSASELRPTDDSETAPDGNGVSIDQQMRMVASNDQEQSVVTALFKKYVGMTDLALGVAG